MTLHIFTQLLYVWHGNKGIIYEYVLPPDVQHAPINQLLHHGRQIHRRRHHRRHHHSANRYHRGQHITQTPVPPITTPHSKVLPDRTISQTNDTELKNSQRRRVPFSDRSTRIWHAPKPQLISSIQGRPGFQGHYRSRPYWGANPSHRDSHLNRNYVYTPTQSFYHPFSVSSEAVRGADPTIRKGSINEIDDKNNVYLEGPVASEDRTGGQLDVYDWILSGFTECTHPCGGGKRFIEQIPLYYQI